MSEGMTCDGVGYFRILRSEYSFYPSRIYTLLTALFGRLDGSRGVWSVVACGRCSRSRKRAVLTLLEPVLGNDVFCVTLIALWLLLDVEIALHEI